MHEPMTVGWYQVKQSLVFVSSEKPQFYTRARFLAALGAHQDTGLSGSIVVCVVLLDLCLQSFFRCCVDLWGCSDGVHPLHTGELPARWAL